MSLALGKQIITDIERPSPELVERFRGLPSSNIGDMLHRMYCMRSDIKAYSKGIPMAGTAITVNAPEGDNLLIHYAIDLAQPGDVIVVNGGGSYSRSLCGEMMFTYAKGKGVAGFVLDGCIRDADCLEKLEFPVYAIGVTPQGPWKNGPGEINVPIACSGQVVFPGDILVGDGDGVVVVRSGYAEEILQLSTEKYSKEEEQLVRYHKGEYNEDKHHGKYANIAEQAGIPIITA